MITRSATAMTIEGITSGSIMKLWIGAAGRQPEPRQRQRRRHRQNGREDRDDDRDLEAVLEARGSSRCSVAIAEKFFSVKPLSGKVAKVPSFSAKTGISSTGP